MVVMVIRLKIPDSKNSQSSGNQGGARDYALLRYFICTAHVDMCKGINGWCGLLVWAEVVMSCLPLRVSRSKGEK